jgi:hypothetical protein
LPQDHKTLDGHLSYHDFDHNICVIQVQSPFHLPGKRFSSNVEVINFDKIRSRDVVTLVVAKKLPYWLQERLFQKVASLTVANV